MSIITSFSKGRQGTQICLFIFDRIVRRRTKTFQSRSEIQFLQDLVHGLSLYTPYKIEREKKNFFPALSAWFEY